MDKYKNTQQDFSRTIRSAGSKMDYEYLCVKGISLIYKVIGLAPWDITRKSSGKKASKNGIPQTLTTTQFVYSRIGCVYHILVIFLTFGINTVSIPLLYDSDYPYKTQMTVTIELAQALCGNLIIIVVRILLCVKQNTAVKLFNRFTNIDGTIVCLVGDRNSESNRLFFVLLFLINALICTTIAINGQLCYNNHILDFFNAPIPAMIINCFMNQYVIALKLIENQFRALNRALLNCPRSNIQPIQSLILGGASINASYNPKVMTFRRTYTILYEITCDVAEFYSLPILLAIAMTCYSTIYNAYYLFVPFVMQLQLDQKYVLVDALFWLIALMLPICMLSAGVNRTTTEVHLNKLITQYYRDPCEARKLYDFVNSQMRKTASVVHKLLARSTTSREDRVELQQFSLELLQRKVQFTAYGLFPLDCTLVHSIFSMVVTYLIILLQFQIAAGRNSVQGAVQNNSTAK